LRSSLVEVPVWRPEPTGLRQASCLFFLTQAAWRYQEALAMTGHHLQAVYHKCEI